MNIRYSRHITGLLTLLLTMLVVYGCKSESDLPDIDATIAFAEGQLSVSGSEQTTTVGLVTNSSNVEYMVLPASAAEWVSVKKADDGKSLTLSFAQNTTMADRSATLMAIAGNKSARLPITQSGNPSISTEADAPSELFLTPDGKETVVDVISESSQWKVTIKEGAEWLSMMQSASSNLIILTPQANYDDEARTAVLELSWPGGTKDITVTQAGHLRYFLPYVGDRVNFDRVDVVMNEYKRGMKLSGIQIAAPAEDDWGSDTPDVVTFTTWSKALTAITYHRPYNYIYPLICDYIDVALADAAEMAPGGGYLEYLLANGFKYQYGSEEKKPKLESEDGYLFASLATESTTGQSYVRFTPQLVQDRDYPTFDAFPIPLEKDGSDNPLFKINDPSWKFAQIDKYHTDRGDRMSIGVKNSYGTTPELKEKYAIVLYILNKEKNPGDKYDAIWYDLYAPSRWNKVPDELVETPYQIRFSFNDYNKIIYFIDLGKAGKQFKVTREFRQLAESAGLEYRGISDNSVRFMNSEKGIDLYVQFANDETNLGAAPTALLTFVLRNTSAAAPAAAPAMKSAKAIAQKRTLKK